MNPLNVWMLAAALLSPAAALAKLPEPTPEEAQQKAAAAEKKTLGEEAAKAEGFTKMELVATLSGEPLYRACGFEAYEEIVDDRGGAGVPLLRMRKSLT